jgi:rhomboid protease GluP
MCAQIYGGFRYKYALTLILVIINVICFVFIDVLNPDLEAVLIQDNSAILYNGAWWQLFTSMWLHANIVHIGSNMIGLLIFGITLESFSKKWQYLVIYLVSGLVGNVASLFLLGPGAESLGASGAIFGVLAAAFILPRRFNRQNLAVAFFFIVFYIVASIAPGVDTWAHLFGAAGGIIFGFLFTPTFGEDPRQKTPRRPRYSSGSPEYVRCPRCGKVIEMPVRYCPYCDLPLGA